jgi:hypothetical protein
MPEKVLQKSRAVAVLPTFGGYRLSGSTLTLTGAGGEFDFDGDGTMDAATMNIVAVKG